MSSIEDNKIGGSNIVAIIATGIVVNGKIYSPESVQIDGKVKGKIEAGNKIVIGKEGKAEANAKTKDALIAGVFEGNMFASGTVEISSTGKFFGNLTQVEPSLTIAIGGLFKGKSMVSHKRIAPAPKKVRGKKNIKEPESEEAFPAESEDN